MHTKQEGKIQENDGTSSGYKWVVFGVMFAIMGIVLGANWMVMPVLFTQMSETTGIALSAFQTIWALIPLAGILICLPAGLLADKYGVYWVIGISLILCTVCGAMRGMFASYFGIALATFLWGGSSYVFMVNYPKVIGQWFPTHQLAAINGLIMAAYSIGAAVGMSISGTVISTAVGGWQNTYHFWAALTGVCTLLWFVFLKEKRGAAADDVKSQEAIAAEGSIGSLSMVTNILKIRDSWYLIIIFSLLLGGWIGLTGLFPSMMEQLGWPREDANNSMALSTVAMIVGCAVLPAISDWIGRRRWIFTVCLTLCGLATVMMFLSVKNPGSSMLWVFLTAQGFMAGAMPIILAIPVELKAIGIALAGTTVGLMNMGSNITGFLFPLAGMSMLNMEPIWSGLLFGGIGFILAGFLALKLTETGQKASQQA
ncbi:MAG: MFS transporter [Deltaproteobacteria bacterium]|jgi:MFS family permease|nr:MFS transporter [Deltaproteobacteria bacterium]